MSTTFWGLLIVYEAAGQKMVVGFLFIANRLADIEIIQFFCHHLALFRARAIIHISQYTNITI